MNSRNSFRFCQGAIATWILVFVSVAIYTLYPDRSQADPQPPELLVVVALAGCLGGVTNNYRRLQVPAVLEQLEQGDRSGKVFFQCLLSPLIGALFAVMAYVLFITGMIEGALFPSFVGAEEPYQDVQVFFESIRPATHVDVAKALLWAIVAGFCESFVPNYLEKLARNED